MHKIIFHAICYCLLTIFLSPSNVHANIMDAKKDKTNTVSTTASVLSTAFTDTNQSTFGQNPPPGGSGPTTEEQNLIVPLLSYNFAGNHKGLVNMTPVINYGYDKSWKKDNFSFVLGVNPYVGSQIPIKDSGSYLPALMLPGTLGLKVNTYFRFQIPKSDIELSISPLSAGYKMIANFADEGFAISQFNLRSSVDLTITDYLLLGIQHTWAWNNVTSESEKTYKRLFSTSPSLMKYLLVVIQTRLTKSLTGGTSEKPVYLFGEWRALLNRDEFKGFDNSKIITIGLRADLSLTDANPAKRNRRL